MSLKPTHESYQEVVQDAWIESGALGRVVLRAGTEHEVYQVWEDFRLAQDGVTFDIWHGSPPEFVPSPLARQPLSSIEDVINETAEELVLAFQIQAQFPIELIREREANAFDFNNSGPQYSDMLLFGPAEAEKLLNEWVREFVSDRVHKHLENDNLSVSHRLLSAFHNGD